MKYPMITASKVKAYALEYSKEVRFQKFTRVGSTFMEAIERQVKFAIETRINRHPSKGKTLM